MNKIQFSSAKFLIFSTSIFLLLGCGGAKDIDKIADAQTCLDQATSSQASDCVAKVDGLTSPAAYLIRCAGKFVREGYNQSTKLATALGQLSSSGSGSNGSLAMMAALAFKAESTAALNSTSAQQAFSYCTLAKSKGLILLSGLVQTSTVLAELGGASLATLDGAALLALMGSQSSNPAAQAAVGGAIIGIYNSNCGTGQSTTGSFCTQYSSAIGSVSGGSSNVNGVGQRVMYCYANPTDTSCVGFSN
jgi:hypothetical protein